MGHVLRQQYIDPIRKTPEIRDIHIDITMIRPAGSKSPSPQYYIIVEQAGHVRGVAPFTPVFYDVGELIQFLLDATTNSPMPGCHRTRLTEPSDGLKLMLQDVGPKGLNARIGDPIAILSDLEEDPAFIQYGIVQVIDGNNIQIQSNTPTPKFVAGAFVQNLSNRWHRKHNLIGPRAKLTCPAQPTCTTRTKDGELFLLLSKPMNEGLVEFVDCYARTSPFDEILPHWIPDIADGNAQNSKHILKSYNGGVLAGGGLVSDLAPDTTLYFGIVGKDQPGEYANRSAVKWAQHTITAV